MAVTNAAGTGLLAVGMPLLEATALPFLQEDFDECQAKIDRHTYHVRRRPVTEVRLDWHQMGVGGDDSWGALPHEQYRLPVQPYEWGVRLRPFDRRDTHKAIRHQQYNKYIVEEVVPFIHNHSKGLLPIITTGASLGALHAANNFFRRPDIFSGTIAMSGSYDLKTYSKGYYDDNVYFNSPVDYLPHWVYNFMLEKMRKGKIIIASGQGDYEDPNASRRLSDILHSKGVNHWLDLWGYDIKHDWPTWRQMLPYFLSKFN